MPRISIGDLGMEESLVLQSYEYAQVGIIIERTFRILGPSDRRRR